MKKAAFLIIIIINILLPASSFAAGCGDIIDCSEPSNSCPGTCVKQNYLADQCSCGTPVAPWSLKIGNKTIFSPVKFTNFGDIITQLLPYIFVIAGLILFGLLIVNGFNFLTSGGDPKKTEGAKGGITAALIGFGIIIAAYWFTQILEYVLHIKILGP